MCVEAAPCDEPRSVKLNIWSAAALEGLLSIDAAGRTVVHASLGAALLLGYRESELVGSPVAAIMRAGLARHHQGFVTAAASGSGRTFLCSRRVVEALHRRATSRVAISG